MDFTFHFYFLKKVNGPDHFHFARRLNRNFTAGSMVYYIAKRLIEFKMVNITHTV